jgi:Phospholipase_D-nuclease N-terminal
MGKSKKKTWGELSQARKSAIVVGGALELVITVMTLRDLARRPPDGVRGPKPLWVMACAVQPVGPLAYWTLGRRTA